MIQPTLTLAEVGEMRILDEVILPLARAYDVETVAGDDCAYIHAQGTLAVTADVGPKPLLHDINGYEDDLFAAGWMAVVATASDVATAGAAPLFLTNCIDAPPELTVGELARFMEGYFQASAEFGFRNGGGDVRHGPKLVARVFGAGVCQPGRYPRRSGVQPGDVVAVVGRTGEFMATYMLAKSGDPSVIEGSTLRGHAEDVLRRPRPQLSAMQRLVGAGIVRAASDTSDGLLGALDNLCRASRIGLHLDLRADMISPTVHRAAAAFGVADWNVFFAWGDWAVAVAVPQQAIGQFKSICESSGFTHTLIGRAFEGGELTARIDQGPRRRVRVVRNENFVSYGFNAGLSGHLDYILRTPLFEHSP